MKKRKKIVLVTLCVLLALFLIAAVCVICINSAVVRASRTRILTAEQASELDGVDYILVLGCGLRTDGSPSDMLADRIKVGAELTLSTDIPLLASGDHGRADYDEVGAIAIAAQNAGVDAHMITLDHAGFSTYESMYRAKEVFSAQKVIIVTHQYHLYRAIYIARELGIDAYGVSADLREYRGQGYRDARELLARVKDFITSKTKPTPAYMGDALPYEAAEN